MFAFRFQRAIDRRYFQVTTAVKFLGMLEEFYFDKIVAWWEQ